MACRWLRNWSFCGCRLRRAIALGCIANRQPFYTAWEYKYSIFTMLWSSLKVCNIMCYSLHAACTRALLSWGGKLWYRMACIIRGGYDANMIEFASNKGWLVERQPSLHWLGMFLHRILLSMPRNAHTIYMDNTDIKVFKLILNEEMEDNEEEGKLSN